MELAEMLPEMVSSTERSVGYWLRSTGMEIMFFPVGRRRGWNLAERAFT
jgi:hypothetical protein